MEIVINIVRQSARPSNKKLGKATQQNKLNHKLNLELK